MKTVICTNRARIGIAFILLCLFAFPLATYAASVSIDFDRDTPGIQNMICVSAAEIIYADIVVDSEYDLYAASFRLEAGNSSALKSNDACISEGSFFSSGGGTTFLHIDAPTPTSVEVAISQVGELNLGTAPSGPGIIASVCWTALSDQPATIAFEEVILVAVVEDPITHELETESIMATVNQGKFCPVLDLDPIGDKSADEGTTLSFAVTASDPEGTIPSLGLTNPPDDSNFIDNGNGTGAFTWIVDYSDSGVYPNLRFEATSGDRTDSEEMTITINNVNRIPTRPEVDVTPYDPGTGTDLACTITTPSIDADGDTVTYRYVWDTPGKFAVHGPTINPTDELASSKTEKGETWTCTVTPNDGVGPGPSDQASVTIVNTVPEANNLQIAPPIPKTEDPLNMSYEYFDIDGDPHLGTEIKWYKDSVHQPAYDDLMTLPSSATAKEEQWHFTVRPCDDTDCGELMASGPVTIDNTPPTVPVVIVTPESPTTNDDLFCTVTGPSIDADGDPVTYTYVWTTTDKYISHGPIPDLTDTLTSSNAEVGETWCCTVTPSDSIEDGLPAEDCTLIEFVQITFELVTTPTTSVNAISFALEGTGLLTADDLGEAITDCTTVARWDTATQSYETHVVGSGGEGFGLIVGEAYFVTVDTEGPFELTGLPAANLQFSLTTTLTTDFNAISLPYDVTGITTAEQLGQAIDGCQVVSRWDAVTQSYQSHVVGFPAVNNFDVHPGEAYFVSVSENIVWP